MPRDYITRAEADELFEDWGRAFTKAILQILTPPGSDAGRAIERDEQLRAADPEFHKAVQAVRAARQGGAYVTVGADMGRREGPGVYKLNNPASDDDADAEVGPKLREIRARARRRRGEE